jgi:Holliday junction resolvase
MGIMQRRKGAVGERELCKLLAEHLGEPVARSLTQTRDGGDGGDVTWGKWAIEIKRQAEPKLTEWWKQTEEQARDYEIPVLAYRLDRRPWRFVVPLSAFVDWPDMQGLKWTAEIGIEAFAMLVRESAA